jgi:hypothetical protein
MSETKLPSIPVIPAGVDPGLARFLQAVRETMLVREGQKGNELDSAVTFRDLIDAGIAISGDYTPNPNTTSVVEPAAVSDSTPPPDPINATVSPAISSIIVTWEMPPNRYNLAYIKIWRSADNNFSNARIIGTGTGNLFVDYNVTEGQPYHYWIQSVSTSDVSGGLIDVGMATPTTDPTGALTQLKGFGVEGLPYYYIPTDTTINGVSIPRGTYIWNAVIGTASIGTAQIKDAAITSAKVVSLTADKITFNAATGQTLKAAYIEGATIVGTTSIAAPIISGGSITSSRLTSTTINSSVINGGEIYVPNSTSWKFKVDSLGNLSATNVNLTGNIVATSGSFSGTLDIKSAQTGARLEITNNVIKVFDASNKLRVQIGDLSA